MTEQAVTSKPSLNPNQADKSVNDTTNRADFDSARSFDLSNSAVKPMAAVAMDSPDQEKQNDQTDNSTDPDIKVQSFESEEKQGQELTDAQVNKCQGKKKYCLYTGVSVAAVALLTAIGSYAVTQNEPQVEGVAAINLNHHVHNDIAKLEEYPKVRQTRTQRTENNMGAWVVDESPSSSWERSGLVGSEWVSDRCMNIDDNFPDDCDYFVDGQSCDGAVFESGEILWHECCNTCLAAEVVTQLFSTGGPSEGRCDEIPEQDSNCKSMIDDCSCDGKTFSNGEPQWHECCGSCLALELKNFDCTFNPDDAHCKSSCFGFDDNDSADTDSGSSNDSGSDPTRNDTGSCNGLTDNYTQCESYVDGKTCDDRRWTDGEVFWEQCCESCLAVQQASSGSSSTGQCVDNDSQCPDWVDGKSCDGRSWTTGETHWEECCASCTAVQQASTSTDQCVDNDSDCPEYVDGRSCDGRSWTTGETHWEECCASCTAVQNGSGNSGDSNGCNGQADNYSQCPSYVNGESCDGRSWTTGETHWEECCQSCLAVQSGGSSTTQPSTDYVSDRCNGIADSYSECPDYVDGQSCDNRRWTDGEIFWEECCVSCLEYEQSVMSGPSANRCDGLTDSYSQCPDYVGNETCDGRQWSDGEFFWEECCVTCLDWELAHYNSFGSNDSKPDDVPFVPSQDSCVDNDSDCPEYVDGRSCDGRSWTNGETHWEECCASCTAVSLIPTTTDQCVDNDSDCPDYVDGRSCDGRSWTNGEKHWDECCASCRAVQTGFIIPDEPMDEPDFQGACTDKHSTCSTYVNNQSCDSRNWLDGGILWQECCASCDQIPETTTSSGQGMPPSNGTCAVRDLYPECPQYVQGESCNNRQWTDGTYFWDECCDTCLDVHNGFVPSQPTNVDQGETQGTSSIYDSNRCDGIDDTYSECPQYVNGQTCDNRRWTDGEIFWQECCVTCLEYEQSAMSGPSPNRCDGLQDIYAECPQYVGSRTCDGRSWTDGEAYWEGCCETCLETELEIYSTFDFSGEPIDDKNGDWDIVEPTSVPAPDTSEQRCSSSDNYSECPKFVNGMSCDGRSWTDGEVFWEQCCQSCLEVENAGSQTEAFIPEWGASGRCDNIEDTYAECPQYVNGQTCDGRKWTDGEIFWEECCNTCLDVEQTQNRAISENRCDSIEDSYSQCPEYVGNQSCNGRTWTDGELFWEECCVTCLEVEMAYWTTGSDSAGSTEGRCVKNSDWYPECPEYVAGDTCDGKAWSDGAYFWDECCESCLAIENGSTTIEEPEDDGQITSCENNPDLYSNCPEMVDGRSCENRNWRDGTPYWNECCESCLEVENASGWTSIVAPENGMPPVVNPGSGDNWQPVDAETNWIDCAATNSCADDDQGQDTGPPNNGGDSGSKPDDQPTGDDGQNGTITINPGDNGSEVEYVAPILNEERTPLCDNLTQGPCILNSGDNSVDNQDTDIDHREVFDESVVINSNTNPEERVTPQELRSNGVFIRGEFMEGNNYGTCNRPIDGVDPGWFRFGVDAVTASRVGCYSRNKNEDQREAMANSFLLTQDVLDRENQFYCFDPPRTWVQDLYDAGENTVRYFDSQTGRALFNAPKMRLMTDLIYESQTFGWPSFRYEEVDWKHVRIIEATNEVVSIDGTHLGFRKFDSKGSRYEINLASIAGSPKSNWQNEVNHGQQDWASEFNWEYYKPLP